MRNAFTACGEMRLKNFSYLPLLWGNISPRLVQTAGGGWFYRVTISRIYIKIYQGKFELRMNETNSTGIRTQLSEFSGRASILHTKRTSYIICLRFVNRMQHVESHASISKKLWHYMMDMFLVKISKYYLSSATCRLLGWIKTRQLWWGSLRSDCRPRLFLK